MRCRGIGCLFSGTHHTSTRPHHSQKVNTQPRNGKPIVPSEFKIAFTYDQISLKATQEECDRYSVSERRNAAPCIYSRPTTEIRA